MKMNYKNLLFLIIFLVLAFSPLLTIKAASSVYVVVQIVSNKNSDCSSDDGGCCLPVGTTIKIDGSNSKTSAEELCAGDQIVSSLVSLNSGVHEISLSVSLSCGAGAIASPSNEDICWIELENNQSCSEGCAAKGVDTYSSHCCETDPDCEMLEQFFGCDGQCYDYGYVSFKSDYYYYDDYGDTYYETYCYSAESSHDSCVASGNYCSYKMENYGNEYEGETYSRICACSKKSGIFEFSFSI